MEKYVSVGVAGHVDHGKTTLVKCLTGVDTDRLKEEKRRGMSIEPAVAPLTLPSGDRVALVDVPGHRDFLKNTIRGLSGVDMAILVVAADDGVMPQTRDHLETLNFLKARGGFTALTKADLVDRETLELAEMELQDILEGSFLQGKPVIPFSAVDAMGRDQILEAIRQEANRVDSKALDGPFRLWIDQARALTGFGTVVSGTVLSGRVSRDDTVELVPSGKEAKVRFMEVHHERVDHAWAGQRAGLNLHGVSVREAAVGTVLAFPGALSPTRLLNVELSLLPTARRPLLTRRRIKLYIGSHSTIALAVIMEADRIHPGETCLAQLRLNAPLAVLPRDPFVISPMEAYGVIGGGRILETPKEKFRAARATDTLGYLQPLQREDVKKVVNLFIERRPSRPVTVEEMASATGLAANDIETTVKSRARSGKLLRLDGSGYFDKRSYEALKTRLVEVTGDILSRARLKTAVSPEEVRFRLDPALDPSILEKMLQELCSEGKLVKSTEGYRVAGQVGGPSFQRGDLIRRLGEFVRNQRYSTFSVGTFWELHGEGAPYREVKKVIDSLHAQKKLVRLNDGRFMSAEAMSEIQERVKELIRRKGRLTIDDFRELLGYGRTRAIPVMDHLDSIGLTRREGDERVLNA